MLPRHPRRTLPALGALLLAAVLSSCGFDYATDRVNNLTAGTFDRSAKVDLLNAVVVSGQDGSGTFIGLLANNDTKEPGTLTSITTEASDEPLEIEPIEIPPGGSAQLEEAGVRLTGDFRAGDYVDITLAFDNGEEISLGVPVYPACDEFEGYDEAPGAPKDAEPISCEVAEAPEQEH